jgi:isochorismate hydrolase
VDGEVFGLSFVDALLWAVRSAVESLALIQNGNPSAMAAATRVEPITDAVHLSIDMQNIFAPGGVWETPWMERVLPLIVEITAHHAARTVFTRFITPVHAGDRPGRWRGYFQKWHRATRAELPASELELVPMLQRFAPPAEIIDKPAYSAFYQSPLASFLSEKGVCTLVITGRKPMSACSRPYLMRSISAFAWLSWRTPCAVRPTPATTP